MGNPFNPLDMTDLINSLPQKIVDVHTELTKLKIVIANNNLELPETGKIASYPQDAILSIQNEINAKIVKLGQVSQQLSLYCQSITQ